MSVSEGIRLQIDALRKEKQELEVENVKFKKQLSLLQEAAGNDDNEMNTSLQAENKKLQEEIAHMKRLYEGTLHQISDLREKEVETRREIKELKH